MSSLPYTIGRLTRKQADGGAYWSYCIKWYEGEQRRRVSLGTTDRVAAEATARKLWAERHQGVGDTIGDIVDGYLASLGAKGDVTRKRNGWKAAKAYWAGLRPHLIDDEVSAGYLAWRGKAINTMRNELSTIRTACIWAAGLKPPLIDKAPKIIVPPIPASKVDHLTKPQFKQFLAGCAAEHVRLFAILGVTTGGRKGALLRAKWDQFDVALEQLDLNPVIPDSVNRKPRALVPLNGRAMEALTKAKAAAMSDYIIEHHGHNIADIKKGIAAASKRSGIHAHPHMFRHSAAVWMAQDRVPMSEIASFLKHTDINITIKIYARYHPDYLRQAARSLDW